MPPSISSLSAAMIHANSIVISGSSFGSKGGSNANKPLIWADFESNIDPTSLGHVTAWDANSGFFRQTGAPQYGVSVGNAQATWDGVQLSFSFAIVRAFTTFYTSLKRRFTDPTTNGNQKFFRIWTNTGNGWIAAHLLASGGITNDEVCGGGQADRFQGSGPPEDVWNMEEFIWRKSTSNDCGGTNTGNGYWENIRNGATNFLFNNTWMNDLTQTYGTHANGLRLMDNFDTNGNQPVGADVYEDDIYLDDTWARVIVTNKGNGNGILDSNKTVREMQIPSAWSGSSITITANRGSFGSSEECYLFVVDSANVPSSGFLFTWGSGIQAITPGRFQRHFVRSRSVLSV